MKCWKCILLNFYWFLPSFIWQNENNENVWAVSYKNCGTDVYFMLISSFMVHWFWEKKKIFFIFLFLFLEMPIDFFFSFLIFD
jgi:hypothetical protein